MTIEKAFAIDAEPAVIWDALWSDLSAGEAGRFSVEEAHRPNLLSIRVKLGSVPVILTYRIEARPDHCEVAVELQPLSRRYPLFQLLSFGHLRRNYEVILVQGLSNLKSAVEGAAAAASTPPEPGPTLSG